ncbi:TatD family hydrolase [Streptomyces radicis]|uniref:TatD family deoxyribonuclease n=1 Tax=Streptomyces radicis TaxID=1750517 RepID=A0A3A9W760_9ACTN|nr:TatD family hydrolase [Streptomyces radicis]RKN08639.1 TatD family deoxyribonuclease [Streptomyces radicis]RKN21797.1 TatD family deoxyribonuclease [Streptomyces radicis]
MPKSAKAKAQEQVPPPLPEPLTVPVADAHTHLDMQGTTVDEALAKATAVGVTRIVQIGCDVERAHWAAKVAADHDAIVAAVALHPNEAPRIEEAQGPGGLDAALREIADLGALPQVVAIGETGLDRYRTGPEGVAAQQRSFRRHIALAKELDKALVIHDRDAHDDVLRILREEGAPRRTVFHCYSGDVAMTEVCAAEGYFMSFAGNVTFASAQPLRDALAAAPPELLLVETDAPFMTPAPFRGRPNAPYLIPVTLRAMAEVKGLAEDELARHVATNAERVFG